MGLSCHLLFLTSGHSDAHTGQETQQTTLNDTKLDYCNAVLHVTAAVATSTASTGQLLTSGLLSGFIQAGKRSPLVGQLKVTERQTDGQTDVFHRGAALRTVTVYTHRGENGR